MNHQAVQPARFGAIAGGPLTHAMSAALRLARVLLAHASETIGRGPAARHENLDGMNGYMRRDLGVESSLGPHSSANRDLLYPRL